MKYRHWKIITWQGSSKNLLICLNTIYSRFFWSNNSVHSDFTSISPWCFLTFYFLGSATTSSCVKYKPINQPANVQKFKLLPILNFRSSWFSLFVPNRNLLKQLSIGFFYESYSTLKILSDAEMILGQLRHETSAKIPTESLEEETDYRSGWSQMLNRKTYGWTKGQFWNKRYICSF